MSPLSDRANKVRCRKRSGFTLIEVILAGMVLVFAFVTTITVVNFGYRAIDNARNTTIASQILQSAMEDIRLKSWAVVASKPASEVVSLAGAFSDVASRFSCIRKVAAHPTKASMRVVTVSVSWNGIDGRPHDMTYTTIYAKDGLYDFFYTKG